MLNNRCESAASCTTLIHYPHAPPSYTTLMHHPLALSSCTTLMHHTLAPPSAKTLPHPPLLLLTICFLFFACVSVFVLSPARACFFVSVRKRLCAGACDKTCERQRTGACERVHTGARGSLTAACDLRICLVRCAPLAAPHMVNNLQPLVR